MFFLDWILSPKAIRERTTELVEWIREGNGHFQIHDEKLDDVAKFVVEVIRENYPDLNIPYHSRWGHFRVGKYPRLEKLQEQVSKLDSLEQARVYFDLVIPSVLLDAGAGAKWQYQEQASGETSSRSEGLAVASYYLFTEGHLSNNKDWRSDAEKLQVLTTETVADIFQVSENNPLLGLEGRTQLVRSLGEAVTNEKFFIGKRPGGLVDYLHQEFGKSFDAKEILKAVLLSLGGIWPGRLDYEGQNLGDVWPHSFHSDTDSYIAFHKLSQWLTYSLIEPLEWAGFEINNLNELTGLAEYRNGGLLVDTGLISLKDSSLYEQSHEPSSDLVIEWRALTVFFLDKIADLVRAELNLSTEEFPLAKVLEGGTWAAGRKIAKSKRPDNSPPIKIISDGTVF